MVANIPASSPPPGFTLPDAGDVTTDNFSLTYQSNEKWRVKDERQFSLLLARKALGKATADELAQFRELQILRRKKRNPLSGDEVLFQYKRRHMEAKLLQGLQEYVVFVQTARGA